MTSWDTVLDRFGLRIAAQRSALADGSPDAVAPFAPPPSLGPIPDELRPRAETLLQEALELQAEIAANLASTTREVQVVQRFVDTSAPRPSGSFVDSPL